jgi:hypothetical protein
MQRFQRWLFSMLVPSVARNAGLSDLDPFGILKVAVP